MNCDSISSSGITLPRNTHIPTHTLLYVPVLDSYERYPMHDPEEWQNGLVPANLRDRDNDILRISALEERMGHMEERFGVVEEGLARVERMLLTALSLLHARQTQGSPDGSLSASVIPTAERSEL